MNDRFVSVKASQIYKDEFGRQSIRLESESNLTLEGQPATGYSK